MGKTWHWVPRDTNFRPNHLCLRELQREAGPRPCKPRAGYRNAAQAVGRCLSVPLETWLKETLPRGLKNKAEARTRVCQILIPLFYKPLFWF